MVLESNALEGNSVGIDLSNGDSNTIRGNLVRGGEMGIKITNSDNNTVESNTACGNIPWDFYHESSTGNVGIDNTCDTTLYWNDLGTSGCTYSCTILRADSRPAISGSGQGRAVERLSSNHGDATAKLQVKGKSVCPSAAG